MCLIRDIAVQSRVRYIRKGAAALRPYPVEQGVLYAKANRTLLAWEMLYFLPFLRRLGAQWLRPYFSIII